MFSVKALCVLPFFIIISCITEQSRADELSTTLIPVKGENEECKNFLGLNLTTGESCYCESTSSQYTCIRNDGEFFMEKKTWTVPVQDQGLNCGFGVTNGTFLCCCPDTECYEKKLTLQERKEAFDFLKCLSGSSDFMNSNNGDIRRVRRDLESLRNTSAVEEFGEKETKALLAMVNCLVNKVEISEEPVEGENTTVKIVSSTEMEGFEYFICLVRKPNLVAVTDLEEDLIETLRKGFSTYNQTVSSEDIDDALYVIVACIDYLDIAK